MAETGLGHGLLIFPAAFDATPPLVLTAAVVIAWFAVRLSDAPAALMLLMTLAMVLTFAIQAVLMFAPAFSGGW